MSTADAHTLMPVAREAVRQASHLVRTQLPGVVRAKGDRDVVSEVDVLVERTVRDLLAHWTPEIGFLGEEEGRTGGADLVWVLDPVDGTSNFVHGIPLCAISLGLVQHDRPILGVIDLPFEGSTYQAAAGTGAFCGSEQLRASTQSDLREAIVAIGDYAVGDGAAEKNRVRLRLTEQLAEKAHRVRMLGSAALDLVWVAHGRLDASILLSNNPWDTAAGAIIAAEAGATVCDIDGTPHTLASTAVIAASPALAEDLLAILRKAAA